VIVGIVRELRPGETLVSATPVTVRQLIALGYDVVVESDAGAKASFGDEAYVASGARIASGDVAWRSDVVLKVTAPTFDEIDRLALGATLIALLSPALNPALVERLAQRPVTALALDAVPRISRAQSLDVLTALAGIAGYRAVVEAAHAFGRFLPGQVTAAGKVPPAKVLVAGAGVAGLAAIGTAVRLGAVVHATDPRPEVADQVRSLGGNYLVVASPEVEVSTTGYAKQMSDDYNARAARLYAEQLRDTDIVITTALVPGKPAPLLVTADMVATMRPGSVVVDMAAGQGGNVAGSVAGDVVVTATGVTIIGYTDLPARMPAQASQMYATNLVNLMRLLTPGNDGRLVLDFDDVVQRSITVVHEGELTWPPPPVAVSAAAPPAPASSPPQPAPAARLRMAPRLVAPRLVVGAAAAVALFLLAAFSPPQIIGNITVFVLAVVIGYYVIGHVHHALHTPLMSVTNAISGIIVVGALLQIGHHDTTITVLASAAILLASINIFGGFAVTRRMLRMFSKA
jgi:NAD(P) transhydrogenase subunit alpha